MTKRIIGFLILIVALVLLTGCTSTPQEVPQTETATATPTAAPAETNVTTTPEINATQAQEPSFAEEIAKIQKITDETGPIGMALNSTTDILLKENPTTGYMWNATVSSGLEIVNDSYIAPENQMPGAGGMHEWTVKAIAPGNQTFTAVYHRPWEPVTASDVTYTVKFVVT
jgi:inhibitor of cysteine peptidase